MENGFKLWYNYVNVNSIFGYAKIPMVIYFGDYEGIAAPQVSNLVSNYAYPGGAVQWWVPNIDLLK